MIKDSGVRREFESGAVRDIQEGKGRCDLLPMNVMHSLTGDMFFYNIDKFNEHHDLTYIYSLIKSFAVKAFGNMQVALLELSIHFEEGAIKYGENNWQKGIPENCYIDSAIRHYLKWINGDKDERHDRAVLWNLICLCYEHERK